MSIHQETLSINYEDRNKLEIEFIHFLKNKFNNHVLVQNIKGLSLEDYNQVGIGNCFILFDMEDNFLHIELGAFDSGNCTPLITMPFKLHYNYELLLDQFIMVLMPYFHVIQKWNDSIT